MLTTITRPMGSIIFYHTIILPNLRCISSSTKLVYFRRYTKTIGKKRYYKTRRKINVNYICVCVCLLVHISYDILYTSFGVVMTTGNEEITI